MKHCTSLSFKRERAKYCPMFVQTMGLVIMSCSYITQKLVRCVSFLSNTDWVGWVGLWENQVICSCQTRNETQLSNTHAHYAYPC